MLPGQGKAHINKFWLSTTCFCTISSQSKAIRGMLPGQGKPHVNKFWQPAYVPFLVKAKLSIIISKVMGVGLVRVLLH